MFAYGIFGHCGTMAGVMYSQLLAGHLFHADDPRALDGAPGERRTGPFVTWVPDAVAEHVAHLPPVAILFATFLGYNPLKTLLGAKVLSQLPARSVHLLTGREFFPSLISKPFHSGLDEVFTFPIVICLIAAVASWSRGGRYVYEDVSVAEGPSTDEPIANGSGTGPGCRDQGDADVLHGCSEPGGHNSAPSSLRSRQVTCDS
jgi:hypothetical protein